MNKRISIAQTIPQAIQPLLALDTYFQTTTLTKTHKELIKIRASQVNGCAYCINMHTKDARKNGETEQRIYLLNAWRETSFFTPEEQCILEMTEEITLISKAGLSENTYQKAAALFQPEYLAQLIMCIVAINAWNRIAIATRMEPAADH